MKQQVQVVVFDGEQYDKEWVPESVLDFAAWLAEKIEAIPVACRGTSRIEFSCAESYDSYYAHIRIHYTREETDAEVESREREEQRRKDRQREQELNTLSALKAKYEP